MKAFNLAIKVFCLFLVLLEGCVPAKEHPLKEAKKLPSAYFGSTDTTNMASKPWSSLLFDKKLKSLLDTALANSFDARIAMQYVTYAKANVQQATGLLKPTVQGGAATSLRRFGLYTMDGAGNITTEIEKGKMVPINLPDYYLGFQAAWEVDIWGKLSAHKRAALARYLATVEGRNLVITSLVSEVATTYYELQALDNQAKILQETIKLQTAALETSKYLKQVGRANELAVEQFENQLLSTLAMQQELKQQIVESETRINILLGRYPQPIDRDSLNFNDTLPYRAAIGIPTALLMNRPDVRQADLEYMATKADVHAVRKAFYPSFNINGSVGFQAFRTGLLFTTPESFAFSLLGGFFAPLINRSALNAELSRANSVQKEKYLVYHRTVLQGYSEVYTQSLAIQNLENIYSIKTRQVATANRSISTSTELFKTGKSTYLEVLFAQQNSLVAKLEQTEIRKRQMQSMINLYRSLGGGWR